MSKNTIYTKAESVYLYKNGSFTFIKTEDKYGKIVEEIEEVKVDYSIKNSIRLPGRQYELPTNCVAFEVFEDYLIIAAGKAVKEIDLKKVVSLARRLQKGLILRPTENIHILYDLDKTVINYNTLNGYPQKTYS